MFPQQAQSILMDPGLWDALQEYRATVARQDTARILHALSQERHVIALHERQEAAEKVVQALLAVLDAHETSTT